jgi:hypothetical protein
MSVYFMVYLSTSQYPRNIFILMHYSFFYLCAICVGIICTHTQGQGRVMKWQSMSDIPPPPTTTATTTIAVVMTTIPQK